MPFNTLLPLSGMPFFLICLQNAYSLNKASFFLWNLPWLQYSPRVKLITQLYLGLPTYLDWNIYHIVWYSFMSSLRGLPWWLSGKESTCECRRHGFDPWVRKIPCRRKWHPLQYSYLGSPMDRGAWQSTVHGVTKESDTTEQQILQGVFPLPFWRWGSMPYLCLCAHGQIQFPKHNNHSINFDESMKSCSFELEHYWLSFCHLQYNLK